jgi:hypothetical protein
MKQEEFYRLIMDISVMLDLDQDLISLVLDLFKTLNASPSHKCRIEVQICASLFLGCKIHE